MKAKLGMWALCLGAAALLATPALAQGQGRGQGQGQGRGMGMGGGAAALLTNEGVQKELKLTEEQIEKVMGVVRATREKHADEMAEIRELGPEGREKMMAMMTTINTELMAGLKDTITAEQTARLHQILIQTRGLDAFADAKVQEALKLTAEQKAAITAVAEANQAEMRGLFQPGGDRAQMATKMAELRKASMEKVAAQLTDEQKAAWKEMIGAPYEVQFAPAGRRPGGN